MYLQFVTHLVYVSFSLSYLNVQYDLHLKGLLIDVLYSYVFNAMFVDIQVMCAHKTNSMMLLFGGVFL